MKETIPTAHDGDEHPRVAYTKYMEEDHAHDGVLPQPSSARRGAGGTVYHPSHTPGGCGHAVGVVLSPRNKKI